jgi:uncharacterized repeat protein (TIGR03803 family)
MATWCLSFYAVGRSTRVRFAPGKCRIISRQRPAVKMIFGPDGNLYGTTTGGGLGDTNTGFGTVFRITTNGIFTPLVLFRGTNGLDPEGARRFWS